jgi:hypothetical protein
MKYSSKLSSLIAFSLLICIVLACSGGSKGPAIPDDKKDYIGDWEGRFPNGTMKLSIGANGGVTYERKEGGSSKSINGGKISKFNGDDFEVTVLLMSTTFKVEKPPYRDGDKWKMVVDGVELTRE